MRLVRTGWCVAIVLACGLTASAPALATEPAPLDVERWQPYGAATTFGRDAAVPGGGDLEIMPRAEPGEIWSSGAGVPIPMPLRSGERVTAVFWARSTQPASVPVTIQGGAPDYTSFASGRISLTPTWRRVSISGVASAAFAPGSQSLTVQLGKARSTTSLGPVAFLQGRPDAASMARAFTNYTPAHVAQDVRIASDPGVVLAGTLRTPGRGAGPFPLAIMIQGHGRNGRGGFTTLMQRLLADGIATLEYDKRGINASTGTYSEDQAALTRDATAAVAAMRRRPELDGARIALVGHSQGAAIAPDVAAADPRIAAVVTFAGPVGDGMDLFRRSMRSQLLHAGHPDATVTPLVEASTALVQAHADGADAAILAQLRPRALAGFVTNGFTPDQAQGAMAAIETPDVVQIAHLHTASDLRSLHIPVLALFGALDPLVTPDHAAAAREALASNPAAKVVVIDGVSHWFKDGAVTGSEAENDKLGANLGSPRVIALAGDWLHQVLVASPAAKHRPRTSA